MIKYSNYHPILITMIIEAYNPDIHNLLDQSGIKPGDAVICCGSQAVPALHSTDTNGLPHASRASDKTPLIFFVPNLFESQLLKY